MLSNELNKRRTHRWNCLPCEYITSLSANRRTAFDFKQNGVEGKPDGMAIDTEGKLWVACFGDGQVK